MFLLSKNNTNIHLSRIINKKQNFLYLIFIYFYFYFIYYFLKVNNLQILGVIYLFLMNPNLKFYFSDLPI